MFWGFKRFFDFQRVTVKFPVSFIKLIDPTSFHILLRRINLENVIKPDKREHKKKTQQKINDRERLLLFTVGDTFAF